MGAVSVLIKSVLRMGVALIRSCRRSFISSVRCNLSGQLGQASEEVRSTSESELAAVCRVERSPSGEELPNTVLAAEIVDVQSSATLIHDEASSAECPFVLRRGRRDGEEHLG